MQKTMDALETKVAEMTEQQLKVHQELLTKLVNQSEKKKER